MATWTVSYDRIPEQPGAGRLGRHFKHDSRSELYPYRRRARAVAAVTWNRNAAILDQGDVGSCTGNAETGALACDPVFDALPLSHPALNEALALKLYSAAETIDGDGPYPPNDNGSSGQSVCQAAKNMGYISGYTWCKDVDDMLDALQHGPVIIGINWYTSFDTPNAQGVMSLPSTATVRGGHEVLIRQYDGSDLATIDNSWGLSWGLQGRAKFPLEVLARLFSEQGDCAVPLALSTPAPTPAPTPTPPTPAPLPLHVDAADRALVAGLPAGWDTGTHTGGNHQAAAAVHAWRVAKDL